MEALRERGRRAAGGRWRGLEERRARRGVGRRAERRLLLWVLRVLRVEALLLLLVDAWLLLLSVRPDWLTSRLGPLNQLLLLIHSR